MGIKRPVEETRSDPWYGLGLVEQTFLFRPSAGQGRYQDKKERGRESEEPRERGRDREKMRKSQSQYLSDNAHLSPFLSVSLSHSFSTGSSVLVSHSLYTCRCLSTDLSLSFSPSFSTSLHLLPSLLLILLIFFHHSRTREQPGYSPTHARDDDDDASAGCSNMQTPNGRCFPVWRAAL